MMTIITFMALGTGVLACATTVAIAINQMSQSK